jgi:hypothetical protein
MKLLQNHSFAIGAASMLALLYTVGLVIPNLTLSAIPQAFATSDDNNHNNNHERDNNNHGESREVLDQVDECFNDHHESSHQIIQCIDDAADQFLDHNNHDRD